MAQLSVPTTSTSRDQHVADHTELLTLHNIIDTARATPVVVADHAHQAGGTVTATEYNGLVDKFNLVLDALEKLTLTSQS
jgi:hypothetical protein